MKPKYDIRKLYSYAIQEDVKSILNVLDTLSDTELSPEDALIKEKFYKRFVSGEENFDYNTDDPLLKGLIDIYKVYWKNILLKEKAITEADTLLSQNLYEFVKKNYAPESVPVWNDSEAVSNPWYYLTGILNANNYFNNVDGKTGNLYDIYIWRKEDTVNYSVELPETNITVPVIFMNDIVTMGWEEYATFGKAYPGGWPKNNSLYCVAKAYDTTKEYFQVSYLLHESQHFSDLETYKDLSSWQLEYRAKLAELSKANETLYKLINYFIRDSKNDSTLSHPYAEYLVISNLSKNIFNQDFVSDANKWESISVADINKAASNALKQNSELLTKM